MTSDDLYARVATLAFSFYERRGREHGYDVEDWIQAEKAILEETAPQNGTPVPKARKSASPKT